MTARRVNPFWRKARHITDHYFKVCEAQTGCNGCPLYEEKTDMCLATGCGVILVNLSTDGYRKHIEQVLRTSERFDKEGKL